MKCKIWNIVFVSFIISFYNFFKYILFFYMFFFNCDSIKTFYMMFYWNKITFYIWSYKYYYLAIWKYKMTKIENKKRFIGCQAFSTSAKWVFWVQIESFLYQTRDIRGTYSGTWILFAEIGIEAMIFWSFILYNQCSYVRLIHFVQSDLTLVCDTSQGNGAIALIS